METINVEGINKSLHTATFTALSLIAFAVNSILCRMALGKQVIGAPSFTAIRLISAAVTLCFAMLISKRGGVGRRGNWTSASMISLYALTFSWAYSMMSTGTGALILFGAVQITMVLSGLRAGERPLPLEWVGLSAAVGGLVYLVLPGLAAPPIKGAALMVIAGVSWGLYSLRGRREADALSDTAGNMIRAIPFALFIGVAFSSAVGISLTGVLLAVLSGAITTGLGYVLWYTALKGLTATRAAIVQLAVPLLAAIGGVVLLSENVSARLGISAFMILGGIGVAVIWRRRAHELTNEEA
jgi:drug/metabolite transporter (DMT)-like permease